MVRDREAWCAAVQGIRKSGHDWVTEQQQLRTRWEMVVGEGGGVRDSGGGGSHCERRNTS